MRERKFTKFFILALFLVAAIAFSVTPSEAKKDKKDHHKHGKPEISAPVKDADHVVVRFSGFVAKPKSGKSINIDYGSSREIDLLNMGDDVADEIIDGLLPKGKYKWIRLKVEAARGVVDSYIEIYGEKYSLWVPSGKRSGLKLIKGFKISADGKADFGIKFKLRKSVRAPRGEGEDYILRPTIKLVKKHEDDDDDLDVDSDEVVVVAPGSITGTVAAILLQSRSFSCGTDARVYLFAGASVVPDDNDGNVPDPVTTSLVTFDFSLLAFTYSFDPVVPGEYTLAFACYGATDVAGIDDLIIFTAEGDVTVLSGAVSVLNF